MTSHEQMIEDCCEAEEKIGLDELEAFASKQRAPLTAYHVTMSDGSSYNTSMAAGITLAEARAYFIGQWFEQADEKTMLQAVAVDPV